MSAVVIRSGQLSDRITVWYLSGKWTTFNVVISHILCLILLTYWVGYCKSNSVYVFIYLILYTLVFGFLVRRIGILYMAIVLQLETLNSTAKLFFRLIVFLCMTECMYVVRLSVVGGHTLYFGQLLVHAELLIQCKFCSLIYYTKQSITENMLQFLYYIFENSL